MRLLTLFLLSGLLGSVVWARDPLVELQCITDVGNASLPLPKSNPGLPLMAPKYTLVEETLGKKPILLTLDQKQGLVAFEPGSLVPLKKFNLDAISKALPLDRELSLEVIESSGHRLAVVRLGNEIGLIDVDSGLLISHFGLTTARDERTTAMTVIDKPGKKFLVVAKNKLTQFGLEDTYLEILDLNGKSLKKIYFLRSPFGRQIAVGSHARKIPNTLIRAYANDSRPNPIVSAMTVLEDGTLGVVVGSKWAIVNPDSLATNWFQGSPDLIKSAYFKALKKSAIVTVSILPGIKSLVRLFDPVSGQAIGAPKIVNYWIYSLIESGDGTIQTVGWDLQQKSFVADLSL